MKQIMKNSQIEIEEIMRIQIAQKLRMKEENIRKANEILNRMLTEHFKNSVVSTTSGIINK